MKNSKIIFLTIAAILIILFGLFQYYKTTDQYLYGNSYRQNSIVNTIRLHKFGITGRNVTIGVIDAGCYTQLPVFRSTRIIKQYDFVTGKETVQNLKHLKGLDHGTNVLSVVGGYKVNELIGIAYGADFILAKTDISTDRFYEEEINAVKASRWLFEEGADIITTSLSFNKFDNADYYYPYQMDGKTAHITVTADSLAEKGLIYISSAGNNYEEDWHIIEPPGDGFNVLAVGSVDKHLFHSFFSSCGPTVDGRIKPDLVAPGEAVWTANNLPKVKPDFSWNFGTSLAAPIVAGIAALVLSTHPELTSKQVIEAIKSTSSKAANPDNLYGWGVPDAERAVSYFGPAFSNLPEIIDHTNKIEINTYIFSSYGIAGSKAELHLLNYNGKEETVFNMEEAGEYYFTSGIDIGPDVDKLKFYFTAADKKGRITRYPSGKRGEYFLCSRVNGKMTIVK